MPQTHEGLPNTQKACLHHYTYTKDIKLYHMFKLVTCECKELNFAGTSTRTCTQFAF